MYRIKIIAQERLIRSAVILMSMVTSGCVLDRSGVDGGFEDHMVFYSCDKNTVVLNQNLTLETQIGDNGVKQIVQFTADCVLRLYDTLEPLNGNSGSDAFDGSPFGEPNTLETVVFRGEYNYNPDEPDWVQGFTSEIVRRPSGELLYEGYWFCDNNPWLNWDGPSYMCQDNYNVSDRFASAYTGKHFLNQYAHWVRTHSLPHVKRVPRTARFISDSDRSLLDSLFAGFEGMSDDSSSSAYIYTPSKFQVFPESFINIDIGVQGVDSSMPQPSIVQAAWRRIIPAPAVVGDIALPNTSSLWEEVTAGPQYLMLSNGIASIDYNSGYFEGNQVGLYEVKVRDVQQGGGWSNPGYFWIGQPSFDTNDLVDSSIFLSESYLNDLTDNGIGSHLTKDGFGNELLLVTQPQQDIINPDDLKLLSDIDIDYLNIEGINEMSAARHGLTFYLDSYEENTGSADIKLSCLPVEHCMEFIYLMPEDEGKHIVVNIKDQVLNASEISIAEFASDVSNIRE